VQERMPTCGSREVGGGRPSEAQSKRGAGRVRMQRVGCDARIELRRSGNGDGDGDDGRTCRLSRSAGGCPSGKSRLAGGASWRKLGSSWKAQVKARQSQVWGGWEKGRSVIATLARSIAHRTTRAISSCPPVSQRCQCSANAADAQRGRNACRPWTREPVKPASAINYRC
jgi:hypothetical protein